jgi:very-short-patch-repair endonuclease
VQELVRLGAPEFVLQYTVRDGAGARIKRVDVAWPVQRTILELDGVAYHDLTAARDEDERVRARMRALGWRVVVARRADLGGGLLPGLVRDLRREDA